MHTEMKQQVGSMQKEVAREGIQRTTGPRFAWLEEDMLTALGTKGSGLRLRIRDTTEAMATQA